MASILTKLLTFKDRLPTGSPSSPLIAYFAYVDMWDEINEIVENANCKLSLYIDDVTISGQSISEKLIWEVKKKIYSNGLSVNESKQKYYSGKQPRQVTGVILTSTGELKVPNRQHLKMHKTRKLIKRASSPKIKEQLTQKLKGLESQANQIISQGLSLENIHEISTQSDRRLDDSLTALDNNLADNDYRELSAHLLKR